MSFLFKGKKPKSKSDSPKVGKKSDGRTKSQPIQPLGATKKSYSKTKSHDPDADVTLGLTSKMSNLTLQGSSDEDFHYEDALEFHYEDALDSESEREASLPKIARQMSTLAPPTGNVSSIISLSVTNSSKLPMENFFFGHTCQGQIQDFKRGASKLRTDRILAPVGTGCLKGVVPPQKQRKICYF